MRISLSVNDRLIARASLDVRGWLGAHISLSQGVEPGEPDRVWLGAMDISDDPNTVHSTWDAVPLSVGDRIEIQVLPDGESDLPKDVVRTSDSPSNLFSDADQAHSFLQAIQVCDNALMKVIEQATHVESAEELKKLRGAIGSVLVEIDRQLISPTLRRHPELLAVAEEMKLR